jgi:hypothetical protein
VADGRGRPGGIAADGREVPVASQRDFSVDHPRTRALVQNASTQRHGLRSYFKNPDNRNFRFFVQPFDGLAYDFFDVTDWQIGWGDLFFASPAGAWEEDTYSLVVNGADGTRAMLPIELE